MAEAQPPNPVGKWNVEITFANDEHRSVRVEAQGDGKGTLELLDPRAKVWGSATSSEAKWSRGEGNAVTFVCKGKFETPDLITGETEFSPQVGDRPSKHGTFRAVRAK